MIVEGRTVAELGAALRDGWLSVRDLYEATLRSIHESDSQDPPLRAFLAVSGDEAEEAIDTAQRALDAGDDVSPLTGIPIAVKDNICTADFPTTCGSRILEGYRSPYEATVVRRLRRAGAILVGKTNLDEFAMGSSTENSGYGPTRNPWDRGRVPGGSSGGSAAAVAAGLVPVALGSDTGGSIRQPASFCGVIGLKPSYGRVSRYGLVAFGSSLDQVGPIARTTEDAALVLQAIAGPDPFDSTAAPAEVPDYTGRLNAGVEGLTVGVAKECFSEDLVTSVRDTCERAIASLESLGAEVREVSLPHTHYAVPAYYLVAMAEASSNLARYDGVRYGFRAPGAREVGEVYRRSRGAGFGAEVKRRIVLGTYGLSAGYYDAYYARGQRVRGLIAEDFRRVFSQGVDLIFTPTSPSVAFLLGERVDDPVAMYLADVFTVPASLAGLPAISVPIGLADGLPVGGQLVAGGFGEVVLLQAARALERALRMEVG